MEYSDKIHRRNIELEGKCAGAQQQIEYVKADCMREREVVAQFEKDYRVSEETLMRTQESHSSQALMITNLEEKVRK